MRLPASTEADILAEAERVDRARPIAIHVRSSVARRLHGLAVVVDDSIPKTPGFEVIREPPDCRPDQVKHD